MSTCAVITFRDDKPDTVQFFQNSWGGAARIWTPLFDKYCKDPTKEYDSWLNEASAMKLWELANRGKISTVERIVLAATFDYAIVKRENFTRFASALRAFDAMHPLSGVNHLPAWADLVDRLAGDETAQAIGFHGTSVTECPWWSYAASEEDENADETRIEYDLSTGDKHFEVYEVYEEMETP